MGGGVRVVHGSIAAAGALLATAAATVDIPDKLHLKAMPLLFYAVPVSMPLPPMSSFSGACACVDSAPFSVSLPGVFPGSDCATPASLSPLREASSSCASSSPYASSPFSLAQGATGVASLSGLSMRAVSHLLPVYLATSVVPHVAASQSVLYPGGSVSTPPVLAPFSFSTSGLYAAPVSEKYMPGRRQSGNSMYSLVQPHAESKFGRYDAQAYSLSYLESRLSILSSFQSLVRNEFTQPSGSLHTWYAPSGRYSKGDNNDGAQDSVVRKPALTVVLLGWLGAQQKHLKKYAEWYNARGIHAVTFVIPMTDILSFKVEKNADEHVDSLARHLVQWLSDQGEHADVEGEKQLMFHTFSNTGWLTYGIILEKMHEQGDFVGRIKGCVIDSAPVPKSDPQVWASGFSAALLKKRSSATKPALSQGELKEGVSVNAASQGTLANSELGGASGLETAVHSVLEGFFSFFLKLPAINQRLSNVLSVLEKKQPQCPQLYIYSTADKVIPVKYVEDYIEEQRKTGRVVRACNLQSSPHVDHFRSYPQLYSEQLSNFLKEVLPSTHVHTDAL
ncbi:hypothetical protein M758_12G153300 [Ceratodon purpureus]|uniref:Transmembrane protein 53 n=1 Tax=Ceratodon purpureus TaxID=3225 RepID=A0A8T0GB50_CERPU|nr:hypothetical protein KC19_12G151100 [Ceratodon purpureus]KAG0599455.1 hypothetical protein M758_12G153300 [Ceratodon purpureus]